MARDEAGPFARGETLYNGSPIDLTNLGGTNLEGKEYVFEVNSPDDPNMADPSGRGIRVRVVRNSSGVNLKPARLAHYKPEDPIECHVDGYCFTPAGPPCGVIDEFLPAAGVPANDLFYIVIDGPTKVTNQSGAPITTVIGSRLVPAATGASLTDDLAGRVALQDLTGATATLGNNVQNRVGQAGAVSTVANDVFKACVHIRG